jgi:hypothetical protein
MSTPLRWRKSSHSDPYNCLELAWKKSSHSDPYECVELAWPADGVAVRDSKNPDGPMLRFGPARLETFITALKAR